jgi:uncharacterized protein YmfQ (DUF2313 family)
VSSREITPFQPTLPAEVPWTDAEFAFFDDSPEHLFPDNQNSNAGLFRKLFSDVIQALIEQQNLLYNERFIDTSTQFLDEYERMVGLPPNPASKTIQQRRYEVALRLIRGPFTRARRDEVIERYIAATFGPPVELTAPGVPITAAGIPLYAESGDISQAYTVVENNTNSRNQVTNASLETDVSGWSPGGSNTFVRDTTRSKFGVASGKYTVVNPATAWLFTASTPLSGSTAGRTYVGSIYVYGEGAMIGKNISWVMRANGGAQPFEESLVSITVVAGWQRISCPITIVENDRNLMTPWISFASAAATNYAFVDGAQTELASSNYVSNGNFETDLNGWWQATSPVSTLSRVTTEHHSGAASMKVVSTGIQSGVGYYLPISQPLKGAQYRVTLYVKGEGAAVGKSFRLQINETGGSTGDAGSGDYFTLTNSWQKISVTRTVAEDNRTGMYFFAILPTSVTGDVFYLDTVYCNDEPIPGASLFADPGITPFYYEVRILNSLAPDMVGLNRELKRITPAGITFDIRLVPNP